MGASLWSYVVPWEDDVASAFASLREDVFREIGGRAKSIEALLRKAGDDGTHTILDVNRVVAEEAPQKLDAAAMFSRGPNGEVIVTDAFTNHFASIIGTVFKMSDEELVDTFGSTKPTRAEIERTYADCSFIERGTGRFAVVYDGDEPTYFWFVGISGD